MSLLRKIKSLLKLNALGLSLGFITINAYAQDNCPAVNCDCASLPSEVWQQSCARHETAIKKACADNKGVATDFCAIHGLNATPLPLLTDLTGVEVVSEAEISSLNNKVAAMYWSLHADLDLAGEAIKAKKYGRGQEVLKLMDDNIENLFRVQRQVTTSFIAYEEEGDAENAWEDYSEDSLKMARDIDKFGTKLLKQYDEAQEDKPKRAYGILAVKALRMAGKAYEHAAYAYVQDRQHDDAAKIWKRASEISKIILDHKIATNAEQAHIDYYRYQTATRLHRASLHQWLDGEEKDAKKELEESKAFMDDPTLVDDMLVEEPEPEEPEEKSRGFKLFK